MGVMVMAAGLKPSRHRKVKGRGTHIPRFGGELWLHGIIATSLGGKSV